MNLVFDFRRLKWPDGRAQLIIIVGGPLAMSALHLVVAV